MEENGNGSLTIDDNEILNMKQDYCKICIKLNIFVNQKAMEKPISAGSG